jgi:hypothetical protein
MLHSFTENNLLGSITSLLEDFLIFKRVLVFKNGDLCSTMSTTSQFISSCIMFALICTKTNQLDLIRGAAYKILLKGKSDISRALISTHIIATICGKRLLAIRKRDSFRMCYARLCATLRRVVLRI